MKTASRGRFGLGLVLGLGLSAIGCSGPGVGDEGTSSVVKELRSQEARIVPNRSEASAAAQSEQQLAVSFLQALEADSNLVFSPHSLSTAFAMLTDAAAGQTLEEIEAVLHFGTSDEAFHRAQDALQLALESRNRPAIETEQQQVEAQLLQESNDVWIRKELPPEPSYLDTLARFYGVGVHQADFGAQPEPSRVAINQKVAKDTQQLISELIPRGAIDDDTVAVLTNALYFKAPWFKPLGAGSAPAAFHELGGTTSMVDMLKTQDELAYYAAEGFASVSLPYYGGELEMLLIVPDEGSYQAVRSALSNDLLNEITTARTSATVNLTLPKFNVKSTTPAAATLKSLGMTTPFDDAAAEFPKLVSESYPVVYIADVLHQATVAIDENGTEASAATAIVLGGKSSAVDPVQPIELNVDRPFLFAIRDNPTGSVLFVGQVVAP